MLKSDGSECLMISPMKARRCSGQRSTSSATVNQKIVDVVDRLLGLCFGYGCWLSTSGRGRWDALATVMRESKIRSLFQGLTTSSKVVAGRGTWKCCRRHGIVAQATALCTDVVESAQMGSIAEETSLNRRSVHCRDACSTCFSMLYRTAHHLIKPQARYM